MAAITVTPANVAMVIAPQCLRRPRRAGTGGVTAGDAVYEEPTTGKVRKGSAGSAGTRQFAGIALSTVPDGSVCDVLEDGWIDGLDVSGMASGDLVYLSDTAGGYGTTAGTTAVVIGRVTALSDRDAATGKGSKVVRVRTNVNANW